MAATGRTLDHNPLKRLKIEDEKDLIKNLSIAQAFSTEYSNDDLSKAIAFRYPDKCSTIRGSDVQSIFSYLEANPKCSRDYARFKSMAARNKYGNGIREVQDALREWDVDIDMAKRK
ncbi:hypothetical protein HO173_009564 [Letharia columbiana]|uniref:Uncharacterized protein n=1 Tax=Letharia columbiana TaxID=112416 RepID=A0A8H6FP78_9LECA|nr:uncharacterized protein HO173_009564 [Letharia columbiana]KAF6232181.1 hypothetical protein HO173_009564 [Letharia columbiana]